MNKLQWNLNGNSHIDGILPKGPHPPCLRMADRALLVGYPRHFHSRKCFEKVVWKMSAILSARPCVKWFVLSVSRWRWRPPWSIHFSCLVRVGPRVAPSVPWADTGSAARDSKWGTFASPLPTKMRILGRLSLVAIAQPIRSQRVPQTCASGQGQCPRHTPRFHKKTIEARLFLTRASEARVRPPRRLLPHKARTPRTMDTTRQTATSPQTHCHANDAGLPPTRSASTPTRKTCLCQWAARIQRLQTIITETSQPHSRGPFYKYRLTLIQAWLSNYMPLKVWYKITYLFPNFKGATVEVWEWITNFISRIIMDVITYPCSDLSSSMSVKDVLVGPSLKTCNTLWYWENPALSCRDDKNSGYRYSVRECDGCCMFSGMEVHYKNRCVLNHRNWLYICNENECGGKCRGDLSLLIHRSSLHWPS